MARDREDSRGDENALKAVFSRREIRVAQVRVPAHSAIEKNLEQAVLAKAGKREKCNMHTQKATHTDPVHTAATIEQKTHPATSKALDAPCHAPQQGKARI